MAVSFLQLVDLFKAGLGGIIVAAAMSPLAIWIAKRVGLMDIPGSAAHKKHLRPTPLAGGIALVLSMVVLAPIFHLANKDFSPLLIALIIIFLFGLWDDAKGLGAPLKLVGQILASIFLIASDVSVHFLEGLSIPYLSGNVLVVLDWGVTILWFIGITNAFNLIDSMDGLAVGIAGIAFSFFMIMGLVAQQTSLAIFSGCLMGICIGLYAFNVSPARLFLGVTRHSEVFAQGELQALAEAMPDFRYDTVVWQREPDWSGATGNPVDLAAAEAALLDEWPDVYVCGPPPMVEAAYAALTAVGVPRDHIHAERFSAGG